MTALAFLSQTVVGLRSALILLAFMSLIAWARSKQPNELIGRVKSRAWALLALLCLFASPPQIAWMIGHPMPHLISRSLGLIGSAFGCAGMIHVLAARGLLRGLSERRVKRGMLTNTAVVVAIVAAAWIVR